MNTVEFMALSGENGNRGIFDGKIVSIVIHAPAVGGGVVDGHRHSLGQLLWRDKHNNIM